MGLKLFIIQYIPNYDILALISYKQGFKKTFKYMQGCPHDWKDGRVQVVVS